MQFPGSVQGEIPEGRPRQRQVPRPHENSQHSLQILQRARGQDSEQVMPPGCKRLEISRAIPHHRI